MRTIFKRLLASRIPLIIVFTLFLGFSLSCLKFIYSHGSLNADKNMAVASSFYQTGDYWKSAFMLGKVLSQNKDSLIFTNASLLLGYCFDSLYLYENEKEVFQSVLEKYPISRHNAAFQTGIMAADLKLEKYNSVCNRFDSLEQSGMIMSIKAKILKSKALYNLHKYSEAINILLPIDTLINDFCEASSIIGLSYLKLKDTNNAFNKLCDVFKACSSNVPEACLNLGELYLNKGDSTCIKCFNAIKDSTIFAEKAQIGICWINLKRSEEQKADSCANVFLMKFPESPFLGEILLVKGYAHFLLKNNLNAIDFLDKCYSLLGKNKKWENDSILNKKTIDSLAKHIAELDKIKHDILNNVYLTPNDSVTSRLHEQYREYLTAIINLQKATERKDMFETFSLKKESILMDAAYNMVRPNYPPIMPNHINDIALTVNGRYIAWSGQNVLYFAKTNKLPRCDTLFGYGYDNCIFKLKWSGNGTVLYAICKNEMILRFQITGGHLKLKDSLRISGLNLFNLETNTDGSRIVTVIDDKSIQKRNYSGTSVIFINYDTNGFNPPTLLTCTGNNFRADNLSIDINDNIYFTYGPSPDTTSCFYKKSESKFDTLLIPKGFGVISISSNGTHILLEGHTDKYKDKAGHDLSTLFISQIENGLVSTPNPILLPHDDPIIWGASLTPDGKNILWTHLVRGSDGDSIIRQEIRSVAIEDKNKLHRILFKVPGDKIYKYEQIWQFSVCDSGVALVTTENTFMYYPSIKPGKKVLTFKTEPIVTLNHNSQNKIDTEVDKLKRELEKLNSLKK